MVDTTRYNTGNELGSNKLEDLSDNAKNIDNFANSGNETFTDRFGVSRKSIAGMESDHVDQINAHEIEHDNQIARHESEFITHIEGMGWTPAAGSFQTGATITARNQTLYDEVSHVFYAWGGEIPAGGYVVSAGSTPTTAGGTGVGLWSDKTDLLLRSELASHLGLKMIGECPDVATLRTITGSSGDKLIVSSYNQGWAAVSAPPTGGGKFRWVEDNSLTDDGVFIFKPTGASGAWVRQYQRKVTPYLSGAKGDNVDDTDAILRCFNVSTARELNVHIDKGQFKYTSTPIVGPLCSISGENIASELYPVGCDGIKFTNSDATGGRKIGGFTLFGTGANDAGYTAIVVDPGLDVSKRTTGVSFEDILIFNFKTAGNFKNLWHSTFRSFNATNVCNGLVFRGRCVSNEIGSGSKIIRGNGYSLSECVGITFAASSDYSPSASVRPEAIVVGDETLVFGFDCGVDVQSMLAGSIHHSDIDYCRSYGIRYQNWDGKGVVESNWIAGDISLPWQPCILVYSMPLGTRAPAGPTIRSNTMTVTNGNAGDINIKIGSQNGRVTIEDNTLGNALGVGVYDSGGGANRIFNNLISAPASLYLYSTGSNIIENNYMGGTVTNNTPINRNHWGYNEGMYCTKDTVAVYIPAGATSGTLDLTTLGYASGVFDVNNVSLTCAYTGGISAGATWASISGSVITAYKTAAFGSASYLYVTIQLTA